MSQTDHQPAKATVDVREKKLRYTNQGGDGFAAVAPRAGNGNITRRSHPELPFKQP
jgi:hypothetical protein